ncbi:MAG: HAMP domain-containing sensor histidine kinase [Phycisphaerales bacterium]
MRSIRRSLTLKVLGRVVPLVVASLVGVYVTVRTLVYAEFDRALQRQLVVLAEAAEYVDGVGMDFDFKPEIGNGSTVGISPDFVFDARLPDGAALKQSQSLAGAALGMEGPPGRAPAIGTVRLPDGRTMRGCQMCFEPKTVPRSEHPGPVDHPGDRALPLRIIVASPTDDIDSPLVKLALAEALVGGVLLGAVAWTLLRAVQTGLQPVEDLSRIVGGIDPANLPVSAHLPDCPQELAPILGGVNGLIRRVDDVLGREKRFASNAAHELRTPIAEIRALAEVSQGGSEQEKDRTLLEIVKASGEMQETISSLLQISRARAALLRAQVEELDLSELLQQWCARRGTAAEQRGVAFVVRIEQGLCVRSDAVMLGCIVNNLVENAVCYSPVGGEVEVAASGVLGGVRIDVCNTCQGLAPEDLQRMFEPFWRRRNEASRGSHSGLGLALARSLCEVLGATVAAEQPSPSRVRMRVHVPARCAPTEGVAGAVPEDQKVPRAVISG